MLSLGLNMPALLRGAGSSISIPSFSRDFATVKTLNHGIGPDITFTRTETATYFDSAGVLTTATANEPRFDHDPVTLESEGLLIEEARTNSIQNSQGTGAVAGTAGTQPTSWGLATSTTGLTRTISTGTISGFNYIDVAFSGTTTGSINSLTFDPQPTTAGYTASSGQTWTGSVYLALVSGSLPPTTSNVLITERDSSNTILVQTSTSFSSATSSLQRFTATRTLNNASTAKITFDIRINSIPTSTAVNFTLRISAPQLEQGAFATSYIPTTSAAVSRGADSAVVTPINSFVTTTGDESLFAEFSAYTFGATGVFPRIVQLDQGLTNTERYAHTIVQSASNVFVSYYVNNVLQFSSNSSPTYSLNSTAKTASGIAFNNARHAFNGVLMGSDDTSITLRTSQNTHLQIGRDGSGGSFLNGHIRKIAYYPKRLSNERLRSMTT